MIRSLVALPLLAIAGFAAAADNAATPGAPPARPVVETFFGTEVRDPYRWLEDTKNPEVAAWMKAQSDHAAATLARIPGRDRLLADLMRYDASVAARVGDVARAAGDRWFYQRRGADENQFKLVMRRGLNGAEKVLVDPEAVARATGQPHAINFYGVAPAGDFVAYGLSAQGSEEAKLHRLDLRTGREVGPPIDRADFGAPSFSPDGRRILFTRLQEMKPGMAEVEKYQRASVELLDREAPVERARTVLRMGMPGVDIGLNDTPFAQFTADGRWVLAAIAHGVQRELSLYVAPAHAVVAGRPQWKRLFTPADAVTSFTYMHGALYLLTHRDAPRFQVLRAPIEGFDLAKARVLVPASQRVITGLTAAADALYIEARDGNVKRLYKRGWAADAGVGEVPLPVQGTFALEGFEGGNGAADPRLPGVVIGLESWTRARRLLAVGADGGVRDTGLQPGGRHDAPADLVATEVMVKSHDGALVPMSLLHRKGVVLDGRNPTLLYGYASYGITEEPRFVTSRLAWLDAGGVWAVANPRGSGVFGHEWHRGGFQATKPNTWKDFIACAEWLVAQKWTAPDRLGIFGGSAGGILVGRAMTERPDLFAAVVPAVGALDTVRGEIGPNGPPNVPEFGTVANEAGFRGLLAMSTYASIQDGTRYPAVLLTHGVNDPRVEVWHSTKTAARLMAASAGGKPVLLRLDYQGGHGIGNTKAQALGERADVFAFLLWQMGMPGWQP
jgi:prolyl oligopeptidase